MSEQNSVPFTKFTERARKVLALAQEEAQRFNHNYIGTEHLLLGLVREGDGVAGRVLLNLGVSTEKVRNAIEFIIGRGERTPIGEVGLTPRAKKVIELATLEARLLNHDYIGTEHLLLGMLREGEGIAAGVLLSFNIKLEKARNEVLTILGQPISPNVISGSATTSVTIPSFQSLPKMPLNLGADVDPLLTNITDQARKEAFDPVIGRKAEMERMIQILSRRNKANVLIVGEPGVGKTALVENLAQYIADESVTGSLLNQTFLLHRSVLSLDASVLAAQATLHTKNAETLNSYLERLENVIARVRRDKAILFIDEIHLLGQAIAEGHTALLNILKQAIAQEQIQVIAATTPADYQKYIQSDDVFGQYLQVLKLAEPNVAQTIEMLHGLRDKYQDFHEVTISDEAIHAAAELAERYPSQRFRPDRAIDLMDEAAVLVRSRHPLPPLPHETILELSRLSRRIAVRQQSLAVLHYKEIDDLSRQIAAIRQEIETLRRERFEKKRGAARVVTKADVLAVLNQDDSGTVE